MIRILGTVFAGLVGLAFGSFLNVCLSRWPVGQSIVRPRSHCGACGRTLAWWENVPLVSWIALSGRCRACGAAISWRYPLVELAVGALWACIVWQCVGDVTRPWPALPPGSGISLSPLFPVQYFGAIFGKMLLVWLLIALAVLDAEHLWLPNWLTFPGIALGLMVAVLELPIHWRSLLRGGGFLLAMISRIESILAAAGLILLIRWIYWLVRRREGIGLGDAKLMAMLGAWLGLPGALVSLVIGVALGAVASLFVLAVPSARRRSERWAMTKLPLGTFLCIGGIISALWGQPIIAAYLRYSGLA